MTADPPTAPASPPFADYERLSTKKVVILGDADLNTIKQVRDYERKFGKRRDVLDEAVRMHHSRRAKEPAAAATPCAPTQYRSAS